MIISFDIDNTLIPYSDEFEVREINLFCKSLGVEPLRKGTKNLFNSLESRGHEIWIYTTSYRSIYKLWKTFKLQGLNPKKFINGKLNDKTLKENHYSCSKNPNLFGIDLHIDDSLGVGKEGEYYDFNTLIVKTDDEDWIIKILSKVDIMV